MYFLCDMFKNMLNIFFFLTGFDNVDTPSEIQKCSNGFEFQFDSKGSLVHLKDPASQVSSRNLLLLSN